MSNIIGGSNLKELSGSQSWIFITQVRSSCITTFYIILHRGHVQPHHSDAVSWPMYHMAHLMKALGKVTVYKCFVNWTPAAVVERTRVKPNCLTDHNKSVSLKCARGFLRIYTTPSSSSGRAPKPRPFSRINIQFNFMQQNRTIKKISRRTRIPLSSVHIGTKCYW